MIPNDIVSTKEAIIEMGLTESPLPTIMTLMPTTTNVLLTDTEIPPTLVEPYPTVTTQRSTIDSMTMVYVPAGEFLMGSPLGVGDEDEYPQRAIYLDPYWIDQTEVTNDMYKKCVKDGGCTDPVINSSWTRSDYYLNPIYADYPVLATTWFQAEDYCKWANRQLPTEAQWEKAARGTDGRTYPWGNEFDCSNGNFDDENQIDAYVVEGGLNCDGYVDTAPVGIFEKGASPYGVLDMAGNVSEWVADWLDSYPSINELNPQGPYTGSFRVMRGGSWAETERYARTTERVGSDPDYKSQYSNDHGFRCSLPIQTTSNSLNVNTIISPKDGMTLVEVPIGVFLMGSDSHYGTFGSLENDNPAHAVYTDAYWIDQTEVTNAQYAKCVKDGFCTNPNSDESYTRKDYFGDPLFDNYPVVWVSWEQANSYCFWAGRRLPTEAEWEKAARGEELAIYPWGQKSLEPILANIGESVGDTTEVGIYTEGIGQYGAYDMIGNVWEWVSDWYEDIDTVEFTVINPTGPKTGDYKVLRGGSWYSPPWESDSIIRNKSNPKTSSYNFGFRCAQTKQ